MGSLGWIYSVCLLVFSFIIQYKTVCIESFFSSNFTDVILSSAFFVHYGLSILFSVLDVDGTHVKHEEIECEIEVETVEEVATETIIVPEIKHDGLEIVSDGKAKSHWPYL